MIAFIDDYREAHAVEPICKVVPIAPSTYHDHVAKRRDPSRRSARAKRDEVLKVEVRRVFEENFRGYACARSGGNCSGKASTSPAAPSPGWCAKWALKG